APPPPPVTNVCNRSADVTLTGFTPGQCSRCPAGARLLYMPASVRLWSARTANRRNRSSMLSGMRAAQKGWLGKAIMVVLFGFLILSFGIWGIGDIFHITQRQVIASVGSYELTAPNYRTAFQDELQVLSGRSRRNVTTAEAFARGMDRQV